MGRSIRLTKKTVAQDAFEPLAEAPKAQLLSARRFGRACIIVYPIKNMRKW